MFDGKELLAEIFGQLFEVQTLVREKIDWCLRN